MKKPLFTRIKPQWLLLPVVIIAFALYVVRDRLLPPPMPLLATAQSILSDAALVERGIVDVVDAHPVMMGATGDILELLPSGTHVEAGEVVLRIDGADIAEKIDSDNLNIQLEEIEDTVREARRKQTEMEQQNRLLNAEARLRLAEMEGRKLRDGLTPAQRRLLEIELRQSELDWLDAKEEKERQQRMHERGFIADAVLERYERREKTVRAALEEKKLQVQLRLEGARDEDLLENQRTVERYAADLARGESAVARRLAQIDSDMLVSKLEQDQRMFDRNLNQIDFENTTTYASTNGVMRVRMYSDWRQGGTWQPFAAGIRKHKYDIIADIVGRSSFSVNLMVHESDVHRVSVGMRARIHVGAFPNRIFWGKIDTVGGVGRDRQDVAPRGYEGSPSGVTMFNVRVRFEDFEDVELHPGMSALAEIIVEPVEKRLLVPLGAVGRTDTGFAVHPAPHSPRARLQSKPIQGRPFDDLFFEVTDGLTEGESIVAQWSP